MEKIYITSDRLSSQACIDLVSDNGSGGLVVFIGNVRNKTKDKAVQYLDFESYEPMALKEMQKIADEAVSRWNLHDMVIHHRVGKVPIGEEAVIIACSSPHRKESFAACEFAIDTLKETVPIWKKEVFEDGEVWVSAHP
ncbi:MULTISPECIES: molybdenum cofactor biosynthesis protein MoaE [Roseivirga]|uniref:Molybdopterin synthase catalytic subunit n=1 Tax=Roseivirga spongicola TaxID=333140 RepID=A0A150X4R0_9BACT|nr:MULTISPECIES: molybdenum cofactor biosynthesis protein MoaE [Roseivirga]KYG73739.1 molybdenum cofactor biosynthesis protein MoaE [Roseivirga spongicola]MBO6660023.1 molybdenum cofactor biosynthesis protein MoaE [Roseivirga sp.]MBO6763043.1 molybdenum cofactor biosynthesis protein MoaE [Roseivirga sp.]MBO6907240.1 molybdenum cofactor biosynthesis protein MoaE [Roseivirga sp.]WPZ09627.1 molybdenum cofactor biosynthesis protein MoaE [Roseivirga spongicola]